MKAFFKSWIVRLLALALLSSAVFAQDRTPFRQEELDQMLAPVALYPDSLLSQILMASTYPLEVVQAARWTRANPGLKGQDAVGAAERMDWDPSVKSLTAFPQILTMMDEKIEWTERLGEAFLAQQADVMDSVQGLRGRAEAAGNLRSGDQMRVERQGEIITIQPPAPEIVYVPYYDPTVVYGSWWWPAYPPVYWAPVPAYYVVPARRPAFLWGSGIVISANFFFGHADWQRRNVTVMNNYVTVNRTTIVNKSRMPVVWQPNPAHRRGVPFHNESARAQFEQSRVVADTRRDADRSGTSQAGRRTDDNRKTDIRQHRMDERRNTAQAPREDGHGERRESTANRPDERAKPAVQSQAHATRPEQGRQPERKSQPEVRHERPDTSNARSDRSVSGSGNRGPGRSEVQRQQVRNADPRPLAGAPGPSPMARVAPEPAPRPQAGTPNRQPPAANNAQHGGGRDHGNQRERSADRDNGRKS